MLFKDECVPNPFVGKGVLKYIDKFLGSRRIEDIVIVDDIADNYVNHPRNGIPIKAYHGDKSDNALKVLT
jgi:TFIIF-interacting CTD phosphatase-like protein